MQLPMPQKESMTDPHETDLSTDNTKCEGKVKNSLVLDIILAIAIMLLT